MLWEEELLVFEYYGWSGNARFFKDCHFYSSLLWDKMVIFAAFWAKAHDFFMDNFVAKFQMEWEALILMLFFLFF